MHLPTTLTLLSTLSSAYAASADEWRGKSIYQIVTDRFALADGSAPACNVGERLYCGGTYAGIMNKLSYIQNMGFDAIWM